MEKQKENNKERKPTDEEVFLSNLKDHPYADSFKGTIKSLEELIEKGVKTCCIAQKKIEGG